jgi:hypothetical protein
MVDKNRAPHSAQVGRVPRPRICGNIRNLKYRMKLGSVLQRQGENPTSRSLRRGRASRYASA